VQTIIKYTSYIDTKWLISETFFLAISWNSTEETKPNTTKPKNTGTKMA